MKESNFEKVVSPGLDVWNEAAQAFQPVKLVPFYKFLLRRYSEQWPPPIPGLSSDPAVGGNMAWLRKTLNRAFRLSLAPDDYNRLWSAPVEWTGSIVAAILWVILIHSSVSAAAAVHWTAAFFLAGHFYDLLRERTMLRTINTVIASIIVSVSVTPVLWFGYSWVPLGVSALLFFFVHWLPNPVFKRLHPYARIPLDMRDSLVAKTMAVMPGFLMASSALSRVWSHDFLAGILYVGCLAVLSALPMFMRPPDDSGGDPAGGSEPFLPNIDRNPKLLRMFIPVIGGALAVMAWTGSNAHAMSAGSRFTRSAA